MPDISTEGRILLSNEKGPERDTSVEEPLTIIQWPILVEAKSNQTISLAYQESGVPIIHDLHIINKSQHSFQDVRVSIQANSEIIHHYETRIAQILPDSTYNLHTIPLLLNNSFLSTLEEQMVGTITVKIIKTGEVLGMLDIPVKILPFDQWGGPEILPELLSAYVTPNHPLIGILLSEVDEIIHSRIGSTSIPGYQNRSRRQIRDVVAAIWQVIQGKRINCAYTPANFQSEGQRIRRVDQILETNLGTSLDLTCLIAGCLEHAGLHPLIVLTGSDTICGVWLINESFPDTVTDDLIMLRKRVDIGELCLFESVGIAREIDVTYEEAIRMGNAHLHNEEAFRWVIDIHRARRGFYRVKPLSLFSTQRSDSPEKEEKKQPCITWVELRQEIRERDEKELEEFSHNSPDAKTVPTRFECWKQSLLDLSGRNQLLNFRETRQSLTILHPDLTSLDDGLVNGKVFTIHPIPERKSQNIVPDIGEEPLKEFLREELLRKRLYTPVPAEKLPDRLLQIQKTYRNSIYENGTSTLFLALGFLSWYETEDSEKQQFSPVLLFPLDIERKNIYDGFTFRKRDEEPKINNTLLHRLSVDFGISIPGLEQFPSDNNRIDVARVLYQWKEVIKTIPRWEIREEAVIGHFSFSKILMWQDLEERAQEILDHPLVNRLHNPDSQQDLNPGGFTDPSVLDQQIHPRELFVPLSADSSQLAAVCSAAKGSTFILFGPPGTGKSQTITNIIAHNLAIGKTVLFVSEKKVALDVVHERLKKCALGSFCLELHSNKSNKREVTRQFSEVINLQGPDPSGKWEEHTDRLHSIRSHLNEYVQTLHNPRNTGESLFHAISRLTALRDTPIIPCTWPEHKSVTPEELAEWRDIVSKMKVVVTAHGHPKEHPWGMTEGGLWSIQWKNQVQDIINSLLTASIGLRELVPSVSRDTGSEPNDLSKGNLDAIDSIISSLSKVRPISPALLIQCLQGYDRKIREIIKIGKNRDITAPWFAKRFKRTLLNHNIGALADRIRKTDECGILTRWAEVRHVRKEVACWIKEGYKPDTKTLEKDLRQAEAFQKNLRLLKKVSSAADSLFGRAWNDGRPDWVELSRMTDDSIRIKSMAGELAGNEEATQVLLSHWASFLSHDAHEDASLIREQFEAFHETYQDFLRKIKKLDELIHPDPNRSFGKPSDPAYLIHTIERLESWKKEIHQLQSWSFWCTLREKASKKGLSPLIHFFEEQPDQKYDLLDLFDRNWYHWWTNTIRDEEPILKTFMHSNFEDDIHQFREIDDICMKISREMIRTRLISRLPTGINQEENTALVLLQKQILLQRRHMPVRTLLSRINPILSRLKPCLLMSPISVAQYLDATIPVFDLVIFDEASQIPVWDAVGAISRGKSVIIVGDPKQLPPTRMFERTDEDDEQMDDTGDLESVLDDCIAARIPSMHLKWHYRSRHESLITFSNYYFYQNQLLTFPSPHKNQAVILRKVNGVFDKGRSRTNHQEAKAVVTEVIRRLRDPVLSVQSIGVVTFNAPQQDLIITLLEKARREYSDIEPFFSEDRYEPLFVKNLENVQGDERDMILFSIGYGPDQYGKVSLNFGPLNRDGGERRLNVAITRARSGIIVFSSLKSEQIDLSRTRAEGVRLLKCFLAYAERGPSSLAETCNTGSEDAESPLEEEIACRLRERGWEVHHQVGCGGYRIDLAIVNPIEPGRYLLGIECDGANYHRAKTARDRDRLRQEILEGLGWWIHRIWSTDWWDAPERELLRIDHAIEEVNLARMADNSISTELDEEEFFIDDYPDYEPSDEHEQERLESIPNPTDEKQQNL